MSYSHFLHTWKRHVLCPSSGLLDISTTCTKDGGAIVSFCKLFAGAHPKPLLNWFLLVFFLC